MSSPQLACLSCKVDALTIPLFLLHNTSVFQDPSSLGDNDLHNYRLEEVLDTVQLPVNGRFVNYTRLICENDSDNIYSQTISESTGEMVYERSAIYGSITVFASSFSHFDKDSDSSSLALSSCLGTRNKGTSLYKYQDLTRRLVINAIKRFDRDFAEECDTDLPQLLQVYFEKFRRFFPKQNGLQSLRAYVVQYMDGFEHGVRENWWGANLLHKLASSSEGIGPVSEILQAKLTHLYILYI